MVPTADKLVAALPVSNCAIHVGQPWAFDFYCIYCEYQVFLTIIIPGYTGQKCFHRQDEMISQSPTPFFFRRLMSDWLIIVPPTAPVPHPPLHLLVSECLRLTSLLDQCLHPFAHATPFIRRPVLVTIAVHPPPPPPTDLLTLGVARR